MVGRTRTGKVPVDETDDTSVSPKHTAGVDDVVVFTQHATDSTQLVVTHILSQRLAIDPFIDLPALVIDAEIGGHRGKTVAPQIVEQTMD